MRRLASDSSVKATEKPKARAETTPHVAVVILNYNTEADLRACAEQIAAQEDVRLSIVMVDNASRPECVAAIKTWLPVWRPDALSGAEAEVIATLHDRPTRGEGVHEVFFIENRENKGYSAGNNTGIRLAQLVNADAVLIVNPDVRIEDRHYVRDLARHLLADPVNAIAASRIVDLENADQNPLREATLVEELTWPRALLRRFAAPPTYVLPATGDVPVAVPKVSGCCLMLRTDFLRQIGNLDENVFLYCEEPILAAQANALRAKILYVPTLRAVHAHVKSSKGSVARRMLQFIQSRKYYLVQYSGYGWLQLRLLFMSYAGLSLYYRLKQTRER